MEFFRKMKFLILGAGPAGLAFANRLMERKETDFLILEKTEEAGGLCKSIMIDNAPLDIGGGHFIDTCSSQVLEMLFKYLPFNEWNLFERNSKIFIHNQYINSPIEANIWQMPINTQVEYLKSISIAGCNINIERPERFVDWIYWKLGDKIANDYMIPYNQKLFGEDLNILGTYWLNKLPSVSFEETLLSCLKKKAYGKQPAHAQFYYPKQYGSGEVWRRIAESIADKIIYNVDIKEIDLNNHFVNGKYYADYIINTIPWVEFEKLCAIKNEKEKIIKQLKYASVTIDYFSKDIYSDAQWIYYPQKEIDYHRILVRKNFTK